MQPAMLEQHDTAASGEMKDKGYPTQASSQRSKELSGAADAVQFNIVSGKEAEGILSLIAA